MSDREWTAEDQAWADKMAEEYAAEQRSYAADRKAQAAWLRKMRRTHTKCSNCFGEGIDGETDGNGHTTAWTCHDCEGNGWIAKAAALSTPGEAP